MTEMHLYCDLLARLSLTGRFKGLDLLLQPFQCHFRLFYFLKVMFSFTSGAAGRGSPAVPADGHGPDGEGHPAV